MEQRSLGHTGLRVSRLGLGTMTWGRGTDDIDARTILTAFLEAGGTFIDCADVYSDGEAERVLGRLLSELSIRDEVVVATKAVSRPGQDRRFDASRGHLLTSLDQSLRRLGTDHVDLWQLHAWDAATPIDETLAAIDTAVQAGKVRYFGVSNYAGWQTAAAAVHQQAVPGRAAIASSQVEYSLLARGVEREVVPAAQNLGLGLIAWSPLGRGVLTGKYRTGRPSDSRASTKAFSTFVEPYFSERHNGIVDAVVTAAEGLGVSPVEVALAWVRDRPGVSSMLVGLRAPWQVEAALASEELELPDEIEQALTEVSAISRSYPEYGWNQQ